MYDFVVAGAGPAGLAAAITAASLGRSVTVLEKGPLAGPEPRGESMPHHVLLDKLMYPGFLEEISGFKSETRRFHSPESRKSTLVKVKEPYYFFEWRDFIEPLYKKAISLGAEFIFNAEVSGVLVNDSGLAYGLEYITDNSKQTIDAKTVLGCGGRTCPVAAHYGIDTDAAACPTIKYRGRLNSGLPASVKLPSGSTDLQFYTILPDSLKSVSGIPPAFAFAFPLGSDKFEAGLMLRLSQFEKLKKVRMPSDKEMLTAWEEVKKSLPGFSGFFTDSSTEYEKLTSIQNRKFIENNIMGNGGAVLLGDAVGMVDANGSAGIYYAMAQSAGWVKMLAERMSGTNVIWTAELSAGYLKQQNSWKFYRYIKNSFKLITVFERLMFRTFGTTAKLNSVWRFIGFLLKAAS